MKEGRNYDSSHKSSLAVAFLGKRHSSMKKPSTLLFTLMASLSLAGSPAWAQSPAAPAKAAEPAKVEAEAAPNVKNFRALQKLNNQIVALVRIHILSMQIIISGFTIHIYIYIYICIYYTGVDPKQYPCYVV